MVGLVDGEGGEGVGRRGGRREGMKGGKGCLRHIGQGQVGGVGEKLEMSRSRHSKSGSIIAVEI